VECGCICGGLTQHTNASLSRSGAPVLKMDSPLDSSVRETNAVASATTTFILLRAVQEAGEEIDVLAMFGLRQARLPVAARLTAS
jgi:hypothetical protein